MLPLAALRASALFGQLIALLQFCKFFFEIHGARIIAGGRDRQMCAGSLINRTAESLALSLPKGGRLHIDRCNTYYSRSAPST
jgi:hypothetical protein